MPILCVEVHSDNRRTSLPYDSYQLQHGPWFQRALLTEKVFVIAVSDLHDENAGGYSLTLPADEHIQERSLEMLEPTKGFKKHGKRGEEEQNRPSARHLFVPKPCTESALTDLKLWKGDKLPKNESKNRNKEQHGQSAPPGTFPPVIPQDQGGDRKQEPQRAPALQQEPQVAQSPRHMRSLFGLCSPGKRIEIGPKYRTRRARVHVVRPFLRRLHSRLKAG